MATRKEAANDGVVSFAALKGKAEGRVLTLAEAVNRYLMDVEAGRSDAGQRTRVIDDLTRSFGVSRDMVTDIMNAQATKRSEAIGSRAERVRAVIGSSRAH